MSTLFLSVGTAAEIPDAPVWGPSMFGYRYTGFRPFHRFEAQLADNSIGTMVWPGGYLAEARPESYGLDIPGLFAAESGRPGLAEIMAHAQSIGTGLSIILPTARYMGQDDLLRADIRAFMGDLLGGTYGPPPAQMTLEIGSEFFASFVGDPDAASHYGHIAEIYVSELTAALGDDALNLIDFDPAIAVQAGRTLDEDMLIRDELSDGSLLEVDQIIHHRFAFNATGVDGSADDFHPVIEAWRSDAMALGGDGPDLFLSAYGVGSYTRAEALRDFLAADQAAGGSLTEDQIDLAGRSTTEFETFWQDQLSLRDYGPEQPRLMLEMLSEYGAEGLSAAAAFGTDMIHPGRLSLTDVNGVPQDFIGQGMLDMLAESVTGTRALGFGLDNDSGDAVWAYGFENADKLIIFLSAGARPPESLTLDFAGLGTTYSHLAADRLTATIPEDWMERFGLPDNPDVDETPEAESFAIGQRRAADVDQGADGLTLQFGTAHEVIRLAFAKTDAGMQDIAGFSDGPVLALAAPDDAAPDDADGPDDLPMLPPEEDDDPSDVDPAMAAPAAWSGGDGGDGGDAISALLLALPLLFLLGGA